MPRMTLDRVLQSQGFGSRRECRGLIEMGAVKIDGETIVDWRTALEPDGLEFEVDGQTWRYHRCLYLALNKPAEVECSRRPTHHRGVLTLLPENFTRRGVQPVGRLDHDTTGLLLLSDDGAFIHALTHPKRHVPKTYAATTATPVTDALIERLRAGVRLADEPALLAAQTRQTGDCELEIVVEQGRYHQVRRMIAAAGNHCVALHRTAIGGLSLDSLGLAEGAWCHLDQSRLQQLSAHG